MATLDDHIAQSLRDSQRSGELESAPSWGKPLKDAGFVPPEVETMQRIAALRQAITADPDAAEANALRQRVSELQQHLALRLEKLRTSGNL